MDPDAIKDMTYDQIVNNVTLQQRLATYFDEQLKEPLRTVLVGRQMFAKQIVIGPDKYRVNFNKIAEMGNAFGSMTSPTVGSGLDNIRIDNTELDLVFHWKEYQIPRQDWQVFQAGGINLNAIGAISASYMTALYEDNTLINGWNPSLDAATYRVNGLTASSGTSFSGADFATFGNAMTTVANGWTAFDAARVQGCNMNLLLSPFNFNKLQKSISSVGLRELPMVLEMLNPYPNMPKGTVLKAPTNQDATPVLTKGTCIMAPVDPIGRFFDLVIGANYINDVFVNGPSQMLSPMGGVVYTTFAPRFVFPTAIGVATGCGTS
ncbi:MAG: encapsulin [Bacteroidales bacterium]|jgi:hypothetical protein